jgi:hypothetical protein
VRGKHHRSQRLRRFSLARGTPSDSGWHNSQLFLDCAVRGGDVQWWVDEESSRAVLPFAAARGTGGSALVIIPRHYVAGDKYQPHPAFPCQVISGSRWGWLHVFHFGMYLVRWLFFHPIRTPLVYTACHYSTPPLRIIRGCKR